MAVNTDINLIVARRPKAAADAVLSVGVDIDISVASCNRFLDFFFQNTGIQTHPLIFAPNYVIVFASIHVSISRASCSPACLDDIFDLQTLGRVVVVNAQRIGHSDGQGG